VLSKKTILVLGIGNSLMGDDGAGVRAAMTLDGWAGARDDILLRDGGTLGLSLLPEIESCDALIVLDAAMMGERPGAVKTFVGEEMDAQLAGKKHSVHELALSDLMAAAALTGGRPERRALIGVQPEIVDWGLEPSPAVAAAIGEMHQAVRALVERWES